MTSDSIFKSVVGIKARGRCDLTRSTRKGSDERLERILLGRHPKDRHGFDHPNWVTPKAKRNTRASVRSLRHWRQFSIPQSLLDLTQRHP